MRKCANSSPYMRRPLVIYDFATVPLWISLYMRKIWFTFLSVWRDQSGIRTGNSLQESKQQIGETQTTRTCTVGTVAPYLREGGQPNSRWQALINKRQALHETKTKIGLTAAKSNYRNGTKTCCETAKCTSLVSQVILNSSGLWVSLERGHLHHSGHWLFFPPHTYGTDFTKYPAVLILNDSEHSPNVAQRK